MPRCFLPRFLALSDTNDEAMNNEASESDDDDEAIDDEAFKDVSDDETAETLCDRRARVCRRVFRLFFYLNHCLNQKL